MAYPPLLPMRAKHPAILHGDMWRCPAATKPTCVTVAASTTPHQTDILQSCESRRRSSIQVNTSDNAFLSPRLPPTPPRPGRRDTQIAVTDNVQARVDGVEPVGQ